MGQWVTNGKTLGVDVGDLVALVRFGRSPAEVRLQKDVVC